MDVITVLSLVLLVVLGDMIRKQIFKLFEGTKPPPTYDAGTELHKLIADGRLTIKRKNEDISEEEKPKRHYELGDDGELMEVIEPDTYSDKE